MIRRRFVVIDAVNVKGADDLDTIVVIAFWTHGLARQPFDERATMQVLYVDLKTTDACCNLIYIKRCYN